MVYSYYASYARADNLDTGLLIVPDTTTVTLPGGTGPTFDAATWEVVDSVVNDDEILSPYFCTNEDSPSAFKNMIFGGAFKYVIGRFESGWDEYTAVGGFVSLALQDDSYSAMSYEDLDAWCLVNLGADIPNSYIAFVAPTVPPTKNIGDEFTTYAPGFYGIVFNAFTAIDGGALQYNVGFTNSEPTNAVLGTGHVADVDETLTWGPGLGIVGANAMVGTAPPVAGTLNGVAGTPSGAAPMTHVYLRAYTDTFYAPPSDASFRMQLFGDDISATWPYMFSRDAGASVAVPAAISGTRFGLSGNSHGLGINPRRTRG